MPRWFPRHFNSLPGSPLSSHTLQINHRAQHMAGIPSTAAEENPVAHPCRAVTSAKHLLGPGTAPALRAACVILTTIQRAGTSVQMRGMRISEMGNLAKVILLVNDKSRDFSLVPTLSRVPFWSLPLNWVSLEDSVLDSGTLAVHTSACYLRPLFSGCHIYQLTEFKRMTKKNVNSNLK